MSLAARFRLRAPNSAGSSAAFARLCLLPLAIVVAAFFLLPMMLGQRVGLEHHAEAMVLGDRIVVMRHGAIAQIGTPREIYFEPASRFVAEFVGAANIVEGTATDGAIVLRAAASRSRSEGPAKLRSCCGRKRFSSCRRTRPNSKAASRA